MKRKESQLQHSVNQSSFSNINVSVQYKKNIQKKQFQLTQHVEMKELNQLLWKNKHVDKQNSEKLIGFQTISSDPLTDFCLYKQIGSLKNDLHLKALYSNPNLQGLNKYKLLKCLATGGFSKVYLARSLINGQFYAAKFIDKLKVSTEDKKILIMNEKQVNEIINYPFLVKMYEFIQTQNFYVFFMDYCPGGELFYLLRKVKRMTQEQARIYFVEILLGIQYLHKQGIMYRDLKPQNIMIDETGHIKIADFGLAKFYRQKSYSFCGSIQYMSPQIVTNSGHSFQVDYYCLGALLFQLLIGCPPFYDPQMSQHETKKNIAYAQVQFPQDFGLSNQVKDLIQKLLIKNPNQRLGHFGGSKQIMIHPWIGKVNRNFIQSKHFKVPFPPNLKIFNFDPDQVGMSQERFTTKIENQYKMIKEKSVQKRKRQKRQSLDKVKSYKQKFGSPYCQNSNITKKSKKNTNHASLKNFLSSKKVSTSYSKFKNLIHNELNRNSSKQKLTKNKSPSFMSVSMQKDRKQSLNKCFKTNFYIPSKLYNMRTQSHQNCNSHSLSSNKLINKKKKLYTQSNEGIKDISNQLYKTKIFSKKNMNTIENNKKQMIQYLQNEKVNKGNMLKKTCKLKIKKFFNENNRKNMDQYGKQFRQTCII